MEQRPKDLRDYVAFLKRRKRHLTIPLLLIFLAGAAVALLLPSIYKSTATILIEGQQIPTDFVRTTVTSFAEERIQISTQRIMSRTRLFAIVNRFTLYPKLRTKRTTEEIINIMRNDIRLETISADVIDSRTGRPTQATIAFTLAYQGKNPEVVQRVTNVLASLYLEENLKTRERQAKDTSSFLEEELVALNTRLSDLEQKIARFKEENLSDLPELMQLNLQTLTRIGRDIQAADHDLKMLEDRKIYLRGQLETIQPHTPWIASTGQRVPTPEERLEILKIELTSTAATLSDRHPDVIKLKKEIRELTRQAGLKQDLTDRYKQRAALDGELETLLSRFTEKHPDLTATRRKIKTLASEIETLSHGDNPVAMVSKNPDNPAYINLATQIESVRLQIEATRNERDTLKKDLEDYQHRLEKTPQVEKAYLTLTRDHENTWSRYQEILKKLMEARVAEGMEQDQKAERFTIIDPAQYPEKPFKPNRLAILLISVILGIGAGVGYASVAEFMDRSVKSTDDLFGATGIPVLASVPCIETRREIRKRRLKRIGALAVVCLAIGGGILAFHLYVMNLEVFWARATRFLAKRFIL